MTQVNRTCREHDAVLQPRRLPRIVPNRELTDTQNPHNAVTQTLDLRAKIRRSKGQGTYPVNSD